MSAMSSAARPAVMAAFCFLLLGLTVPAIATEPGSLARTLERAGTENKLVVLDFYTDW